MKLTGAFDLAALTRDGQRVLLVGAKGSARLRMLQTGKERPVALGDRQAIRSIAFHPRSPNLVVVASGKYGAALHDLESGAEIWRIGDGTEFLHAAVSADGARLVTAARDHMVRLWDVPSRTSRLLLKGHTGRVLHTAFSGAGKRVVSAADDRTARIWDVTGVAAGGGRAVAPGFRAQSLEPDAPLSLTHHPRESLRPLAAGALQRGEGRARRLLLSIGTQHIGLQHRNDGPGSGPHRGQRPDEGGLVLSANLEHG